MNAEIITIGTELLLGAIVDTNSAFIARALRNVGVDLFYQTTVGDNEERAATAISAALGRADVVITTGGLGPTVDDVTRQAVARATGRSLEFRSELLEQIATRFGRWGTRMSPNNRQQAYVPAGAIGLENPVGTAPCFIVETERGHVISLPGVPREMIYMFENVVVPYLQEKMGAPAVILARVLRTAGVGESRIDTLIQDLERLPNPTVGLAAHAGQTDIRVTAKASSVKDAERLIEPIVQEIQSRLGLNIYGEGAETVEEVLLTLLHQNSMTLAVAEAGMGEVAKERLGAAPGSKQTVRRVVSQEEWVQLAAQLRLSSRETTTSSLADRAEAAAQQVKEIAGSSVGLAVLAEKKDGRPLLAYGLATPESTLSQDRGYGGPPEYASTWAVTLAFDRLRRWLLRKDK